MVLTLLKQVFSNSDFSKTAIKDTSFIGTTFARGTSFEGVILSNANFNNAVFYRDTFNFKDAVLTNVSFEDINIHELDFSGATIDAYTLESLANAVNKNPDLKTRLNFNGAKIKGDLSQKDLSNLPLVNADLSAFTSMNGTILNGTDLRGVRIDEELLTKTIGLKNAETNLFAKQELEEILNAQNEGREKVITAKIATTAIAKLVSESKLVIASDKPYSSYVNELAEKLKADIKTLDPYIANYVYGLFEANYAKLGDFDFKNDAFKHYADLVANPQSMLQLLLDQSYVSHTLTNENLGYVLQYEIMKNLIADTIGKEPFGQGNNHGKDFMLIREHLSKVFSKKLSSEEKQALYQSLIEQTEATIQLKHPDCDALVNTLRNKYYAQTKYTMAGIATSGIYLPENALNKLVNGDLADFRKMFSQEQQLMDHLAKRLGEKGAEKLFGTDMSASRQADTRKITMLLRDEILPIVVKELSPSSKHKLLNLSDEGITNIIGEYSTGYWRGKGEIACRKYYMTVLPIPNLGMQLEEYKLMTQNYDLKIARKR